MTPTTDTPKTTSSQPGAERCVRYLAVGAVNTLVGYLVGLGLYYRLSSVAHIAVIGLVANIAGISFSFLSYKFFVFKTKGNWLREYLRCYVVYGGAAVFGIAAIWVLVDGLRIPFWLAQGGVIAATVFISYFGHSRFSFAAPQKNGPN